jgi:hypothetical protein
MQIVIEIPEETYEYILNGSETSIDESNVVTAVRNGMPLPKGHGRLKDIDEIDWYGCTTEYDCQYKNRDCKDCDRAECSKTQVDSIPVLISADKTGNEDKE